MTLRYRKRFRNTPLQVESGEWMPSVNQMAAGLFYVLGEVLYESAREYLRRIYSMGRTVDSLGKTSEMTAVIVLNELVNRQ